MFNHRSIRLGVSATCTFTQFDQHGAVFHSTHLRSYIQRSPGQSSENQRLETWAKHLGIFVTVPKQRDPSERIVLENGTLTIGFLKSLKRTRQPPFAGRTLASDRTARTHR